MNFWHRHTIHSGLIAMLHHLPNVIAEDSESRDRPVLCATALVMALDSVRYMVSHLKASAGSLPEDAQARRLALKLVGLLDT